jgi:xanthine dehydrogenase YagS FAD-binding subunit
MLSAAILSGASGQIRNMATVGGNILQRTRCAYFYDVDGARCNKRNPGDGCAAIGGFNRYHAILGAAEGCIATHPSDMCVALAALDAIVHLRGPEGVRERLLNEFYRSPSVDPQQETVMRPGELITGIQLPPSHVASRSSYRKVRDRTSYAFALVSVAAGVSLEDGRITEARLALGGVSWRPWRARKAEAVLKNQEPSKRLFLRAALEELSSAQPLDHNAFKVRLAERTIISVLGKIVGDAR